MTKEPKPNPPKRPAFMSEQLTPLGVAVHVKDLPDMIGEAAVYRMHPPHVCEDPLSARSTSHEYVVISAMRFGFSGIEETLLFPSGGDKVTDWGELPGSLYDTFGHQAVADNINYTLATK